MSEMTINHEDLAIHHDDGACCLCGCTEERACPGGCTWEEEDLCTACVELVRGIVALPRRHQATTEDAIARQLNPNILVVALWNGKGDWRRAMIRTRLERLLGRTLAGGGR